MSSLKTYLYIVLVVLVLMRLSESATVTPSKDLAVDDIASTPQQREKEAIVMNAKANHAQNQSTNMDWPLVDWAQPGSPVVARGLQNLSVWDSLGWYMSFSIIFPRQSRFGKSTLEVRGWWLYNDPIEWAIIGGTGRFTLAQGVVYGNVKGEDSTAAMLELRIHVYYTPMKDVVISAE
ncbi:hypothetical protein LUZ63_013338 [Rhynchospora breviuscula]|uniref:Dirigent protein n=1 Tax=Rhynchospora breviuscula TaxID=2022672 RepID=A0A9Q0C8C7_9POAL|nr:hypothetical protein LUZ63_013338 [Rhynchospora breviuscula]